MNAQRAILRSAILYNTGKSADLQHSSRVELGKEKVVHGWLLWHSNPLVV